MRPAMYTEKIGSQVLGILGHFGSDSPPPKKCGASTLPATGTVGN